MDAHIWWREFTELSRELLDAHTVDVVAVGVSGIGIDGLPTPDGGIRPVIDGRIDATYIYPTGGAEAIDYAVQILEDGGSPAGLGAAGDQGSHVGERPVDPRRLSAVVTTAPATRRRRANPATRRARP